MKRTFVAVTVIMATLPAAMCAKPDEPGVRVEIQRVEVPVPVKCINASDVPASVPTVGKLPADARNAADILAAAVLQLRAVDRELRALIHGCIL